MRRYVLNNPAPPELVEGRLVVRQAHHERNSLHEFVLSLSKGGER